VTKPRSVGQRVARVADIGLAVVTVVVGMAFLAGIFYLWSEGAGWVVIPLGVVASVTFIVIQYIDPKWEGYYR
jgi:hypothetical protein